MNDPISASTIDGIPDAGAPKILKKIWPLVDMP
jgi:hypothetical protein